MNPSPQSRRRDGCVARSCGGLARDKRSAARVIGRIVSRMQMVPFLSLASEGFLALEAPGRREMSGATKRSALLNTGLGSSNGTLS